jgi:NAD(P)-dependent dehydrogenase (short-subunit alcohol dehydrogenase family)
VADLAGKRALLTGGSSGIGAAIAGRLIADGAAVVTVDLAPSPRGLAVAEHIVADVTEAEAVRTAVETAVELLGGIDILCNSAGISPPPKPLAEIEIAEFDRVMSVNTRSVFLLMKAAIPTMVAGGGGAIINIASIGSFVAQPGFAPYYASKGACLMLTRAAAVDYAAAGIRANAICPGVVETPLLDSLAPDHRERMVGLHPVGRLGEAGEIAAMAAFLASDECRFATGAAFTVDGGRTAV